MKIAIVGTGMAGLACADALVANGAEVRLFDKGRGPGGRMSTRRVEAGGAMLHFDHGAQYFTARDADFIATVAGWEAAGIVARWPAAGDDAWVGVPGMNAPVRAMAERHTVAWGTRIDTLARHPDGWRLDGDDARHDAVVVAVPGEQVAALVAAHAPAIADHAQATPSEPCWTLMAAFDAPVVLSGIVRGGRDDAIGWAARDAAKPGRDGGETWVVQAGAAWSTRHLEDDADDVARQLLAAMAAQAGGALPPVRHAAAHRWRYARTTGTADGYRWDAAIGLGVCGDWLMGPRVEAAWCSGRMLAAAMLS